MFMSYFGRKMMNDKENDLEKQENERELRFRVFVSVSVASFYVLVSSSMVFANKGLMHDYDFEATNLLLLFQFVFTTAILKFLHSFKILNFEDFNIERAKKLFPISFFYCANTSVALLALRGLNVAAYSLVKRLTVIVILFLEIPILHQHPSLCTWVSVFWMVLGTIIAANYDLVSSLRGVKKIQSSHPSLLNTSLQTSTPFHYFLGFISCCFQSLYLIFVKKSGAETGLDSFGVLYYHSILSIPLIIPIIFLTGEWSHIWENRHNFLEPGFNFYLFLSLSFGTLLNYALFLCTEKTTPLTTMVSGHIKSIAQIIFGLFAFGGVKLTPGFTVGLFLSIGGGLIYMYEKYQAMKKK